MLKIALFKPHSNRAAASPVTSRGACISDVLKLLSEKNEATNLSLLIVLVCCWQKFETYLALKYQVVFYVHGGDLFPY